MDYILEGAVDNCKPIGAKLHLKNRLRDFADNVTKFLILHRSQKMYIHRLELDVSNQNYLRPTKV